MVLICAFRKKDQHTVKNSARRSGVILLPLRGKDPRACGHSSSRVFFFFGRPRLALTSAGATACTQRFTVVSAS